MISGIAVIDTYNWYYDEVSKVLIPELGIEIRYQKVLIPGKVIKIGYRKVSIHHFSHLKSMVRCLKIHFDALLNYLD